MNRRIKKDGSIYYEYKFILILFANLYKNILEKFKYLKKYLNIYYFAKCKAKNVIILTFIFCSVNI
jgi:hypothetical protein